MDKTKNPPSPFVKKVSANTSAETTPSVSKSSSSPSVMQSFSDKRAGVTGGKVIVTLVLMVFLGVGVGYGASIVSAKTGASIVPSSLNPNAPAKGKVFGNGDPSTFKDTAEGVLKNGGIDGEGQYHLVRPGGDSQNVYLTSSTVDLSQFIDQKIKVWGETQSAEHAGWLMDVGRVQVE
jgi:hypothetical protein